MCDFVEILFTESLKPDDITIIDSASSTQPGKAQLRRAIVGQPNPKAPNSKPLLSWTGESVGFVAHAHLIEAPFDNVYWLEA